MLFHKRSSMSRTAITLKCKMSRLCENKKANKQTTTTTKAKENRLKCLKADITMLTHFTC